MRRRFSMFAICGSRSARSDDENNKITDSLEQCLTIDKGIKEFQTFLKKGRFEEDAAALEFYLKCKNILIEVSRQSPNSRTRTFSAKLQADTEVLYEMANDVNFDQHQMEALEIAFSSDSDQLKIDKIEEAQQWSVDILQQVYETFRKHCLDEKR